jgi:proteasome lid subunit RPN8/RPN11
MDFPDAIFGQITTACQQAHPNEACGLWWKTPEGWGLHIFSTDAISATSTHFSIPPQTLLPVLQKVDQEEGRVCGWFHSHPNAPPYPSSADLADYQASSTQIWWPNAWLLLLSPAQDTYAWCLYAPDLYTNTAVAWGITRPPTRNQTIL